MIRTYKFRIYPKKHQIKSMNTMLNLSCELYNAMLQQRIYAYRSKKKVNYRSQQNEIPDIKKMFLTCILYLLDSYTRDYILLERYKGGSRGGFTNLLHDPMENGDTYA
ncbi:MAG: helix-turn-helix domain-containing protein [Thermoplasmataceae archaeon]